MTAINNKVKKRMQMGADLEKKVGDGVIRRFNTSMTISVNDIEFKAPKLRRQFKAVMIVALMTLGTVGCSSKSKLQEGQVGYVGGFLGAVVADEPRAALVGRQILSRGGSAADAASAMYFMMSVTLPSRAGLGGGGVCLAFDAAKAKTEVLDFTAQAPAKISPASDRPTAIPGNPRGFFALQARYGRLMWREIIGPAEHLARFGFPASRTFARDLQATGSALLMDPSAREMFAGKSGVKVAQEGEPIDLPDLAATLGLLRARGVGPMYTGPFAQNFTKTVNNAGGSLTTKELRNFIPKWRATVRVDVGFDVAHFAPPPAAASSVAAVMTSVLEANGDYGGGDVGERATLLAETQLRAFADRSTWLNAVGSSTLNASAITSEARIESIMQGMNSDHRSPLSSFEPKPYNYHENPSATGFSAVDAGGNAVACAVTMNAAFGTGRVAKGTGILLASAPSNTGRGAIGLAPMLLVNENAHEFKLAATASGGVAAPSALMNVVAGTVFADENLRTAISQPRVHLSGAPDVTYHEPNLGPKALKALSKAGHRTQTTPEIGQVNALYCAKGLPSAPETCQMATDPRGSGLASGSMR